MVDQADFDFSVWHKNLNSLAGNAVYDTGIMRVISSSTVNTPPGIKLHSY